MATKYLKDVKKWRIYFGWVVRRALLMLFDVFAVNLSCYFALVVRFYMHDHFIESAGKYLLAFEQYIPYNTVISILVFLCFRLYSSRWKYAGINDINRIIMASLTASAIHVLATVLFVTRMPITYYAVSAVIQMFLLIVSRFSYRIWKIESTKLRRKRASLNVMIVGMGETGRILRGQIESDPTNVARPVCIFTHRGNDTGTLDGLPVISDLSKMKDAIAKYKVRCVILADSIMPPEMRGQIRAICKECKVEVQDFSGYLQNDSGTMTLKRLMEYTSGPVIIVVDGKEQAFENGEKVLMTMTGHYAVKRISAKNSMLVVELADHPIILNDVNEEWVQELEGKTGEKISFF